MTRHVRRIGLLLALLVAAAPASAQRPLNLGFETPSVAGATRPWGWSFGWNAFGRDPSAQFTLDSLARHDGNRSLRVTIPDSLARPAEDPPAIQLMVPADFAWGHRLRLSGWMRVRGRGRAALTVEAIRGPGFRVVTDTAAVVARAAVAWTERGATIRVPRDSTIHSILITADYGGPGTAWFDDLTLRVDGHPIATLPLRSAVPSPADRRWLLAHAQPLRTVDADTSDADLARFTAAIADARLVALGESTHGTHEFFLLKRRLLEHLVRTAGVRVFAIEANQLGVERIDRYVRFGQGTSGQAIRALFAVWNTEEMLGLIEWLRDWNQTHPSAPVFFVGYDMQDQRTPADTLRAFLARREPGYLPRFDALAGEYRTQRSYATPLVPDTTRARWHRQAETLCAEVERRRATWLAGARDAADTLDVEWAVQSANLLRQAARFNETLNSPERDSLMAANLDWALRVLAPGARAVVWAHDVHVSHGGDPDRSFNAGQQMGAYLARTHGAGYRSFSLLTHDGAYSATRSFTDYRFIAARATTAPANSLEGALHSLTRPPGTVGWFVDLRDARRPPPAGDTWLAMAHPIRHIGYAAYDYGFELDAIASLEFDGVFFVDHTTASHLLP